ncbi:MULTISPECIES: Gfo/Idh/MocA family protein [unclassified Microbacterium]|uniref:Gfo/Idh/MocA family protein n=1 Tax=unclassified Microbacterium TaxID=2609290 RepID=UPI000C2C9C9F|nr:MULTISPECIES: Gfo/Idh/MocA family oxidoreductase [unclassified Microbacterium]
MGQPHGIGIIGLGVISRQYLATLQGLPGIRIVATADLDAERAAAVAADIPGCRALSVDELVADPAVQTVINLTIPAAHAEVALAALAHGKNVYGEKPLAATLAEAGGMMDAAGSAWVGSAPDTVLGTGIQTARAAIDAGRIGRPTAATATWVSAGHEAWHPHPDFYYREGGGPLLDMGPYYLTSLVHLLGPVARVSGASSRTRDTRRIGSGPREGEIIPVEVDTHVTGVLEHVGGAVSTVAFSFDAVATTAAPLEIHGETGSLTAPDPNTFDGEVRVRGAGEESWQLLEPSAGYEGAGRGIGVIDFLRDGERGGRASGAMALHVLEIMTALLDSARTGARVTLQTVVERPSVVPLTSYDEWSRSA